MIREKAIPSLIVENFHFTLQFFLVRPRKAVLRVAVISLAEETFLFNFETREESGLHTLIDI